MTFKLSKRDADRIAPLHEDLQRIVRRAADLTATPFMVVEGLRTAERQKELLAKGATKTLDSRHLTGHAVDLAPLVGGQIPWSDRGAFETLATVVRKAASDLDLSIRWGGDWNGNGRSDDERFYDGPHFELPRAQYPA